MTHLTEQGQRKAFLIHAAAFVATLLIEAVVNVLTGPPYWVFWVLGGWSVGLFAHWYFGLGPGVRRR